jgi:hypothetical protein
VSDTNQGAGAALERAIRDDLPDGVEFDPREEQLLRAAARQADDIERWRPTSRGAAASSIPGR